MCINFYKSKIIKYLKQPKHTVVKPYMIIFTEIQLLDSTMFQSWIHVLSKLQKNWLRWSKFLRQD